MKPVIYRLVWFELQVSPHEFRFAIIPGQPVLFGYQPDDGSKAKTLLVPYEGRADLVDALTEAIDGLINSNQLLELPPNSPESAFQDDTMNVPSVHIRIAYADGRRWASFYPADAVPPAVRSFLEQSKQLGIDMLARAQMGHISGEQALGLVDVQQPSAGVRPRSWARRLLDGLKGKGPGEGSGEQARETAGPTSVIAKVKVTQAGEVRLNGSRVSLPELEEALRQLKSEGGIVWYHRENTDQEPSAAVSQVIQSVLESITSLKLPVRLVERDFE